MYPSATDGTRPNNNRFSECSVRDMGVTIESNGGCFLKRETNEYLVSSLTQSYFLTDKVYISAPPYV